MQQVRGFLHRHEPEEGADGGKPSVAAACAVAALRFYMRKEVAYEGQVYILHLQFRRSLAGLCAGEPQQQAEGVTVARNRVRARLHLGTESVGEELLEQRGECDCRHGRTSSTRWTASSSNSGMASMYQYVYFGSV